MANKEVNLQIKNLTKKYDNRIILNNLNFDVYDGEFLSILGPSGCGKTTLLKILIGIEKQTSGSIIKGSTDITSLDPSKRSMGIVFQNYALFPNMTALKNVEYALKIKYKDKEKAHKEAIKMLEIVNMKEHMNKYPHELSGGQQQRVGIARALANNPDILLMDEPFGAVDEITRRQLQDELLKIYKQKPMTILFVTHDIQEALKLGTKVLVMDQGKIQQFDTPNNIMNHPANNFVRKLINVKEDLNESR